MTNSNACAAQQLGRVVVITLECTLWSGREKLHKKDLACKGVRSDQLPPKALSSLGSHRTFDSADIRAMERPKEAMEKLLSEHGAKIGTRMWALPSQPSLLRRVETTLNGIVRDGYRTKAEVLSRFEKRRAELKEQYPDWAHLIDEARCDRAYVEAQVQYRWMVFHMAPLDPEVSETINDGLTTSVASLGDTALAEVSKIASDCLDKSFEGRTQCTQRSLNRLRSIHSKLDALSFVDAALHPLAQRIREVLETLPKQGPIAGSDFMAVVGLLSLIADPAKARAYGAARMDARRRGEDIDEVALEGPEDDAREADSARRSPEVVVTLDDEPEPGISPEGFRPPVPQPCQVQLNLDFFD